MTSDMATTTINNNSIMSFGRTKVQRRLPFPMDRDDPYDQDILRPKTPSHALIGQTTSPRKRHRENVSIIPIRALDAPDILLDDSITLVDTRRGAMAVALHDEVYLWQNETVTLLATIADAPYTCVRWSTSGDHIALGQEEFVQIYSKIKRPDNGSVCFVRSRELYHHSGFVTAIVWKGMEIVAAGDDGLKRCNVKEQTPPHTTYRGHNGDEVRIVGLEWQNNTIASAGSDDKINLFDASRVGNDIAPRCTMVHPGVRILAFSPHQPNLLVSGGEGGVQFWNVLNGSLRASLKTEEPVVGVLFPKSRDNMILVAHGDKLSLWNFSPKMTKIGEAVGSPNARVLSLAKGPNGRVVCTNSDERIILFSLRQEPGRNKKMKIMESDFGTLKMPVIR